MKATHVAFDVACGSSRKKIMVKIKVVPVAIILQVMVLAICLFLLFINFDSGWRQKYLCILTSTSNLKKTLG